ncbi:AzlC family ABC transporter permease [Mycolicibacterium mengxianglii]|uniref:AzlC family ABC transporter permease n=1 Tax=Mycolicibacterium mengxianglii TaxID=2736649 RepID=UPI0018EF2CB0|nr:AzlC family ABC transporter permease [Mycolicibacterium mengxianglii]
MNADGDRARVRGTALLVGLTVATYGIPYGAVAVAAGLDVWQVCFLSLVMFTGGSQFALVGIIAAGGTAAGGPAIANAALLGVRNMFYGVTLAPIIRPGKWRRLAAAHLAIDESTAVATAQATVPLKRLGFWVTGAAVFVVWNVTSLLGALLGQAIGDVRALGLDAAAPAAFLGLLWPQLKRRQARIVAIASALVAVAATPLVPAGLPVLLTVVIAVLVGTTNAFRESRPAQ